MIVLVRHRALTRIAAACAASALAVGAAACGSSGSEEVDSAPPPDYEKALADAPAPLASIYDEANELLPGGLSAYEERIAELDGYPIVVNKWASWCGPCRHEFPWFQEQAAKRGEEIAFLGIDSQDSDDAAMTFLEAEPVPYPSYKDPDEEIAGDLDAYETPSTIFYDSNGEIQYVRRGGYQDQADFVADIERYAK
jgi:thiol-disulfide isomerase/thioredoxin